MTPKTNKKEAPKTKGEIVDGLKQKDIQARVERFNKKMDIILSEEQFAIKLITKCNPQTLEVNPAIQLVDLKYGQQAN
jgi:predicted metal-dependent TIM-barrel fold hydrolase